MCYPISLIITEDKVFLPPEKVWNHSHTFIMKIHNIPDGMIGDKYLRLEVTPPNNILRDKKTNKKLAVNKKWKVKVDETYIPDWYSNDLANQEDRVREAAKKWFENYPDNLLDGYKEATGDDAVVIAGNNSTLTAGNNSTLTAGGVSKLTAGKFSILIAGDASVFCAGEKSSFSSQYWYKDEFRIVTFHVGKKNILPNKEYKISNGKIYDEETGKRIEPDKTLKKKAKKNKE